MRWRVDRPGHAPVALALGLVLALGVTACPGDPPPEEPEEEPVDPEIEASLEALGPVSPEDSVLLAPESPEMTRQAPDSFQVRFETTAGDILVSVHREWAPEGADRFYNLARQGFFDGVRFSRVIEGFVAQFGIHGDPRISAAWREARIPDDPVRHTNERGTLTFAMAGPDTRTTQIFINLVDNPRLDDMGFAPFGEVVEGLDAVERLHAGYGEGAPRGAGPAQDRIQALGNPWLEREFPELDHVERARVVGGEEGTE